MKTKTDARISRVFFGLAIIVALLGPVPGFGQGNPKAARVRALNNKAVQHHERARSAAPDSMASIRAQAAPDFKEREEALADLIEDDPQEAVKFAFSPELLTDMGKEFPDSAAHLERFGTWQGTLEYAVADDLDLKTAKNIRRLKTDKETLHLHLSGPEPPLTSGMTVTVTGVAAGGNVAAQGEVAFASAVVGPAGMACGNTGAQHVVTILANLPSYTLGAEVDQEHMKGILYGNANSSKQSATDWSLDDFWQQNSDGQTSAPFAGGKVVGPYLLNSDFNKDANNATYCDYNALAQAAIDAADGEVNFQNYNRVTVVFPYNGACSWAGLSSLGCWTNSSAGDGSFTSSISWLRSDLMTTRSSGVQLATHELGHGLGMHHASSRNFAGPPREPLGAVNSPGYVDEYGDLFSTMGSWNFGFYNAPHAQKVLGWLAPANYQIVQSTGQYSVQAYETRSASGMVKALKIQRDAASGSWVWLEYRTNTGIYDSQLNSQVWSGALLHYEDISTSTHSHLLDLTPGTTAFNDPSLAVGQTWVDPFSSLSITVNSIAGNALNVTVTYGPPPCVRANPTVVLSPPNPTVGGGSSTDYTVTVTNNDSAVCTNSTFNLTAAQASGFTGTLSPTSLSLAPGASATVTLTEVAGTTVGTYPVSVSATNSTNSSYTGMGSANITVLSGCILANPIVTLSPLSRTVLPSGSTTYTVTVKNNDAKACASSTFTFVATQPTGFTGTLSKTSSSIAAGATLTITLTEKAGTVNGNYSVSVKATKSTNTSYFGTGTAAMTVAPCTLAAPTVTLSPASISINFLGSAIYNVTLTNNNSAACAAVAYKLTATQPTGLTGTLTATTLTVASGATGTTKLTEKAASTAGTFAISVTGTHPTVLTSKATATATTIVVPTTVTVTTDSANYKPLAAVTMTAYVAGATPFSAASVTFTLKKANGVSTTYTTTTNTSGIATWKYTLASADPNGTYTASAKATVNRVVYSSSAKTFTVAP